MTTGAASTPRRLRRERTKGYRMPEGAVYVGRPTKFGNPYPVGVEVSVAGYQDDGLLFDMGGLHLTAENVVELYRVTAEVRGAYWTGMHPEDRRSSDEWLAAIEGLRGKDLVCWCPLDKACHADVLLEIANA